MDLGLEFLREEPEVVPELEQPLEDLLGLIEPALQGEVVGEPERAGQEHAFVSGQTIHIFLLRSVTQHETLHQQIPLDRMVGDAVVLVATTSPTGARRQCRPCLSSPRSALRSAPRGRSRSSTTPAT